MNNTSHCENCRTPLAGQYCHHCGQNAISNIRFFGEILLDLLSAFFSYDSKVNRTLKPLLFKPGFLSNEFIEGRRVHYLHPFRLYLFTSVLCFLVLSLQADQSANYTLAGNAGQAADIADVMDRAAEENAAIDIDLSHIDKRLDTFIRGQVDKLSELTPAQLTQLLIDTMPPIMLVLLPVLALLIKLLYLGSGRFYMEHLIVVLHSQSFLFLLICLLEVNIRLSALFNSLFAWPEGLLQSVLMFWALLYIPLMLRRVYRQSRHVTALKYIILLISYFFFTLMLLLLSFAWNLLSL